MSCVTDVSVDGDMSDFLPPQSQEANKQKIKKKKVKKAGGGGGGVTGGGGEKHWNELFTLPEREGMMGEDAATNDT